MRRVTPPGAYVPAATPVHALDARVKLVLLLLATAAAFSARSAAGLALVGAGLALALAASRTSLATVLLGVRPAALVLGFSLVANAVVLVGQPGLSAAGLARGATAVVRVVLVVGYALVLSATTMAPAVADALSALLSPLGRLGVPVGSLSMMVSVALRFIPLTTEEVGRIRCAQAARGARLDEGGVVRRLRGWGQVLVPLLVGLFRRADELASAMEDRCYAGGQTSLAAPLPASGWATLVAGALWAVAAALL